MMTPSPGTTELKIVIVPRDLRFASGLVLFAYITTHLSNHGLGLISLDAAETGLWLLTAMWHSLPGTLLLYSAAGLHFTLALRSIYERRTFRLPPLELLRIALGFWMPVLLLGHAITTRLEFELIGSPTTYARVVSDLWATDSEWRQLGLLAPGWLHGCLGFHFALCRYVLYQKLRPVLFAVALLLPVLSALGFVAMGKELARAAQAGPAITATVIAAPAISAQAIAERRAKLNRWRRGLLYGYFAIIGLGFLARGIRNLVERGRKNLVTISYGPRSIRVPRGWSVLEASRAHHIRHAAMCGGVGRCSTCRVRVVAGGEACAPPSPTERETLERVRAPPDVRLACQLRPSERISVIPLVRTDRPVFRQSLPRPDLERDAVLVFCDFLNRAELSRDHIAQDLLFVFVRSVEAVSIAIRAAGGTISYVDHDSVCALFGLAGTSERAARQALRAAGMIEQALRELNGRLGRQWACKAKIVVSIHAGRAIIGEVGGDGGAMMAVGNALEVAMQLRTALAAKDKSFGVSLPVISASSLEVPSDGFEMIELKTETGSVVAYLSDSAPRRPQDSRATAPWRTVIDRASGLAQDMMRT
jgi:adenylate cyclase